MQRDPQRAAARTLTLRASIDSAHCSCVSVRMASHAPSLDNRRPRLSARPLVGPVPLSSLVSPSPMIMSRRRSNRRKTYVDSFTDDEDEEEERKEDKRPRQEPAAAAASSSSAAAAVPASSAASSAVAAAAFSAAAAAAVSSSAAASVSNSSASSSSSAVAAASSSISSSPSAADLENVECVVCDHAFECADESAHLPRTLPCGHLLCAACIRKQLSLTPGRVQCPSDQEHGEQEIRIAQSKSPAAANGSAPQSVAQAAAARAEPTIEDWLRQLPPAKELITAIRIQQQLLMQLKQLHVRCCFPDCAGAVTHFCADCGDLCSAHEQSLHALEPFQSHKTGLTALKADLLRDRQQSSVAAAICAQADELAAQQAREMKAAEDELKQLEAQTQLQLQKKRQEVEAKQAALGALKQTADRMRAADASSVLKMEANRLASARLTSESTVLSTVDNTRVHDLQTFLGPVRLLSKAKLIYRASRDGVAAKDWWRQCGGKASLLTIVKVKSNGFVFGVFTPFQWPVGVPTKDAWIADPSGTTFLFSLVSAHGRAVQLRLKGDFGCDLSLMNCGQSADSPEGNWTGPGSFQFDCVADGGKPIVYDKTLLAGDDGKGQVFVRFAAAEIESWQL